MGPTRRLQTTRLEKSRPKPISKDDIGALWNDSGEHYESLLDLLGIGNEGHTAGEQGERDNRHVPIYPVDISNDIKREPEKNTPYIGTDIDFVQSEFSRLYASISDGLGDLANNLDSLLVPIPPPPRRLTHRNEEHHDSDENDDENDDEDEGHEQPQYPAKYTPLYTDPLASHSVLDEENTTDEEKEAWVSLKEYQDDFVAYWKQRNIRARTLQRLQAQRKNQETYLGQQRDPQFVKEHKERLKRQYQRRLQQLEAGQRWFRLRPYSFPQKYTSLVPLPKEIASMKYFPIIRETSGAADKCISSVPDVSSIVPQDVAYNLKALGFSPALPRLVNGLPEELATTQAGSLLITGSEWKLGNFSLESAADIILHRQNILNNPIGGTSRKRKPEAFLPSIRKRSRFAKCCLCPEASTVPYEKSVFSDRELIGPFATRSGKMKLYVHFECATWAPEVFIDTESLQFRCVYEAYSRGRRLPCFSCGQTGATVGCYVESCQKVYHYCCLANAKCRALPEHFVIFCAGHASRADMPMTQQLILAQAAMAARRSAEFDPEEEVTAGLDCPHSCYTGLRRNETEVIFSRKWQIASHDGWRPQGTVLLARRKNKVIDRLDMPNISWTRDGVCVVFNSAFDEISGRLEQKAIQARRKNKALMSALGISYKDGANMEEEYDNEDEEEQRPLIKRSPLFLLRSFQRAPGYDQSAIRIIRPVRESARTRIAQQQGSTGEGGGMGDHSEVKSKQPADPTTEHPMIIDLRKESFTLKSGTVITADNVTSHSQSSEFVAIGKCSIMLVPRKLPPWTVFYQKQFELERDLHPQISEAESSVNVAALWTMLIMKQKALSEQDPAVVNQAFV